MRVETTRTPWKDRIAIVQGLLTSFAIVAAGVWFFIQGTDKPEVDIELFATSRLIVGLPQGSPKMHLVTFQIKATNLGRVPVHLENGTLTIYQMNPEPRGNTPLKKYCHLGELFLPAGETDRSQYENLNLDDYYKTVLMQLQYSAPRTIFGIQIGAKPKYLYVVQTPIDIDSIETHMSPVVKGSAS